MSKWNRAGTIPEWMREGPRDKTQLPVIVYGTLRTGQGNWKGRIEPFEHTMTPVTVNNHAMYPMSGFPFVVPQEGASIVAEIAEFREEDWESALRGLDNLEGYRGEGIGGNLYNRVRVIANMEDGSEVEAYIYVAASERSIQGLQHYPAGDWLQWKAEEAPVVRERIEIKEKLQSASGATLENGVGSTFLENTTSVI